MLEIFQPGGDRLGILRIQVAIEDNIIDPVHEKYQEAEARQNADGDQQ